MSDRAHPDLIGALRAAREPAGDPVPAGRGGPLPQWRAAWAARFHAAWPDLLLAIFALLQLLPFLGAFHQSADDNFWQFATLSTLDRPADLAAEVRKVAEQQGRIGAYPALLLVLPGAMLPEYAAGRLLLVGLFGLLLLGFAHLMARRFGVPLTRAAFLLSLCVTPMAAHHLPPNAYPLLITLPLLALVGLHLLLAASIRPNLVRALLGAGLVAATLVLEYALVAGLALAAIAVVTASPGRRRKAIPLHGAALLASLAIYLGYRAAFPSDYQGNMLGGVEAVEVLRLQALHLLHGTVLPYLAPRPVGRTELSVAALLAILGALLAARFLPALSDRLRPRTAGLILLGGLGWAWLNTLPHALTPKYQAWCRAGDCGYVDSRVAALVLGAVLAAALAVAPVAARRLAGPRAGRALSLLLAGAVGLAGAGTFLTNRAAAREMAGRERAFGVLRDLACHPETGLSRSPAVIEPLARTVWWHLPPALIPPAGAYLEQYAAGLARLGLDCRPLPFAPPPGALEFLGWSAPEATGRWSLGAGGIVLSGAGGKSGGVMLTLAAYVPPGGAARRVIARTADGHACPFTLGQEPRVVFLPWARGAPPGDTLLILDTPDATSPAAVDDTEDPRTLGVLLPAGRLLGVDERPAGALDLRACRS